MNRGDLAIGWRPLRPATRPWGRRTSVGGSSAGRDAKGWRPSPETRSFRGPPQRLLIAPPPQVPERLTAAVTDRYRIDRELKLRVDPEPSRVPQRDSVVAELAAVGDIEAAR